MKIIDDIINEMPLKKGYLNKKIVEYDIYRNQRKVLQWKAMKSDSTKEGLKIIRNLKSINYETAIFVQNRKTFNTYFFKKNYDVVITDRFGQIISIFENLEKDFMSEHYKNAHFISFFPVGSIKFFDLKIKDRLQFIRPVDRVTVLDLV